jgi:hypothetical protein
MIRYRHSGEGRGRSKAFQRYPGGQTNNLNTDLRRYNASFAGMTPEGSIKGIAQLQNS